MAGAPTLRTPRLVLEPFSYRHLSERYIGWLNDPRTVRFSEQRFHTHTLDSCREYVQSFEGSPNLLWAITLATGCEHIGNISAHCQSRHGTADVGVLLGQVAHNQGYATEAWLAVLDHLLRTASLRKVTAGTLSSNAGMLAVIRKSGMTIESRRARQYLWEGQEVDEVGACVFREDWLALYPAGTF